MAYPVLVKAREGRPIHVEGNGEHPLYRGKTSFHATADLLGLYDPDRLRGPLVDGRMVTWKAATEQLARALEDAAKQGKGIALVTPAVLSPTRKALIARLAEALPSLRHVPWEPAADHQDRQAQRDLFGEIRLPRYRFDKAQTIVALEADFAGFLTTPTSAWSASGRRCSTRSATPRSTSRPTCPTTSKWAEAMGCVGIRVESPEDVGPAIEKANSIDDRPVVVDFRTDAFEKVFPMVAAGASNDDIVVAPRPAGGL